MNNYRLQKIIGSKAGMAILGGGIFFVLMWAVSGATAISDVVIFALGGAAFGVFFSLIFHKKLGTLIVGNLSREKYEARLKFVKMLKNEQIPTTKAEKAEYVEYLNKIEALHNRPEVKRPIGLILIMLLALYSIVFEKGLTVMRVLAIFLVVTLTFSLISTRRSAQRIKRVKAKMHSV